MQLAFQEAQKAFDEGEVPVGCVIVRSKDNYIVATSRNLVQHNKNPNSHAEILAINLACLKLDTKNLSECDIYITLEPCTMCAAAIAGPKVYQSQRRPNVIKLTYWLESEFAPKAHIIHGRLSQANIAS